MANLLGMSDSYKYSHYAQYPDDTRNVSSYIEARGGADKSVFFGLQAFIKKYLLTPIPDDDFEEMEMICALHGVPYYKEGFDVLRNDYGSLLPLAIEAVAEGTVMETKNVQVQIQVTDPRVAFLDSFMETSTLRAVWYPSTVATIGRRLKAIIKAGLEKTSDKPVEEQLAYKLHDFGARGASSHETASIGGMAHLVNFKGSDTMEGIMYARKFYNSEMPGHSIPASEHSTITSWGRSREKYAYINMIKKFGKPGALYGCVSDSYNIWEAILMWKDLEPLILEYGGTLVVRPDSGDPLTVPVDVIRLLMVKFGYTINSKGYRVLPDHIRVIQGDGLNEETLPILIQNIIDAGISIENIAFGMGGGLLQKVDRDNLNYAMKASAIQGADGNWSDVYKDPVHGGKTSKRGLLGLIKENGIYKTVSQIEANQKGNLLRPVFRNGELLIDDDFETVRARAEL